MQEMDTSLNQEAYLGHYNSYQSRKLKKTLLSFCCFWLIFTGYLLILGSYRGYDQRYANHPCISATNNCTDISVRNDCYQTANHCQNVTCYVQERKKCVGICPVVEDYCNEETEKYYNNWWMDHRELDYKESLGRIIIGKEIYNSKGGNIVSISKGLTYFLYFMTFTTSILPAVMIFTDQCCN